METANSNTLSGEPLKDLGLDDDDPVEEITTGAEAIKAAAETKQPDKLTPQTQQSALDWFIGAEPIGGEGIKVVKLNVGPEDSPSWIEWKLKAIELDTLRKIRQRSANTREARRSGNVDEFRVNLEIVAAGTVEPDLNKAAKLMADAQGSGVPSAADVLRLRFHNRPGYITQLAGKVLTASGFDEEDVQDATQVQAAGN